MGRKTNQRRTGTPRERRQRLPAIERAVSETLRSLDEYVQRSDHMRDLDRAYERAVDELQRRLRAG